MAITSRNPRTGEVTTSYVGRVLKVRTYNARRNMSDTLDYSDWQDVKCTDALVCHGGTVPEGAGMWVESRYLKAGEEIPLERRFSYVDCSNHFAWRGAHWEEATPDADEGPEADTIRVQYREYLELMAVLDAKRAAALAKDEAEAKKRAEEYERNRPVVGKRMEVFKGRKVPVGTKGTVAWISHNGGVLLKDDSEWKNRKADGVWVNPGNLRAR